MRLIEPPAWVKPYIGIPFADHGDTERACNCYGLNRLIFRKEKGIELQAFDDHVGTGEKDIPRIAELVEQGKATGDWIEIPAGREHAFDGVLIRKRGHPTHTGLVVVPGLVLHTLYGAGSMLFEYRMPQPRHRILGFYRHKALI